MQGTVLSLFPGIDLFGRAFTQEGFCVVRGPDLLFGQDVRDFFAPLGAFLGIIGGSPCQDFSRARRSEPTGEGDATIAEFARVVTEAQPVWFVLENVPGVPRVNVAGYKLQLINISAAECGGRQSRRRVFQFGWRDGPGLIVRRGDTQPTTLEPCCLASEASRKKRRSWSDFCELQGLPRTFDLPGWSLAAKYRMVGNGVPVMMGRAIAIAIRDRFQFVNVRGCVCGCGRAVEGDRRHANAACRKRMQRSRDANRVTGPEQITAGRVTPPPARSV